MCLIQIVIFLFAASLSMMNDGSQGGGVMNGSTLAPLHALLILLLYYSYNPAGCSCPPYTLRSSTEGRRRSGGGGGGVRAGGELVEGRRWWSSSYCKAPPPNRKTRRGELAGMGGFLGCGRSSEMARRCSEEAEATLETNPKVVK